MITPTIDWIDLLAAPEPMATAGLLAAIGMLVAVSVLVSRSVERLGVPVVLLFLVLGMLGGSEGIGGLAFNDVQLAVRLGTMALVLILLDGGLNTSIHAIRQVLLPASLLATVGVVATAGLTALFARMIGLAWPEAMLLGSVVSSTDAAAVFAVLRGGQLRLKERLGNTLEVESCGNDPMAVILTTTMISIFSAHGAEDGMNALSWWLAVDVITQLLIGCGMGIVFGFFGRWLLRKVRLSTVGLYPALTLAIAFISYGVATLVQGSGFLAVYATAITLGAGGLPNRSGLVRVHQALAWLSQIAMFLMLGLLVYPSQLLEVAWVGLGVGLFLAFIARPLAVFPCILPFGYSPREMLYVGWIGLRGAVPIILATFPILAQVPGSERLFHLVFFIVVVSSIMPGSTIRWITRWLKLDRPETPTPSAVLEINSALPLNGELVSFFIEPTVAVCGASLSEIEFPPQAAVILIVRGNELLAARGQTVLMPGDHVYVFFRPENRPIIELLFGRPEEGEGTLASEKK